MAGDYFAPYVDGMGRVTGYGTANLDEIVRGDWRLGKSPMPSVERALIRMPHRSIRMSNAEYERWLKRYERLKSDTGGPPTPRNMRWWYGRQTTPWL
jgi:hypothetical protein